MGSASSRKSMTALETPFLLPFLPFLSFLDCLEKSRSMALTAVSCSNGRGFIASGGPESSAGSIISSSSNKNTLFFFPFLPLFLLGASQSSSSSSIILSAVGSCSSGVFIALGGPETSAGSIVSPSSREKGSFFFPFLPFFFFFGASQFSSCSFIGLSVAISSMLMDAILVSL